MTNKGSGNAATGASSAQDALSLHDLDQQKPPLLRLPRELRDQILGYLFAHSPPRPILGCRLPVTMHTCQQLREETAQLYYPKKTWICLSHDLDRLATAFDPQHKQYLYAVSYAFYMFKVATPQDAILQADHLDKRHGLEKGTIWVRCLKQNGGMRSYNALGTAVD
ncbi:hypothetical protein CB0940_02471 [Cercospora beticola]|nr:hypothetical protein CB0940_02471 [Cercospora beticola]PIA99775.1 hypothetical protein CB0940_02471 [Cercospora beticola]CAK1362252.1 unnamed protein product [Cercospora beticola]